MDSGEETLIMIGTSMVLLITIMVTLLAIMIIYRKRKIEHRIQISNLNAQYERELLQTHLEVQQHTMQHIGRELHDSIGQQLTLITLFLSQITPRKKEELIFNKMTDLIKLSMKDVKSISSKLNTPESIVKSSLNVLIKEECEKVRASKFCEITYQSNPLHSEVPDEIKSFILRIFQEFIQNSLKHSQCTHIEVQLTHQPDHVNLYVRDNGVGFDLNQVRFGLGIRNMKKRARMVGGTLELASKKQIGTTMKLNVRLQPL